MQWHPRQGALMAEHVVGLREGSMRLGWNRQDFPAGAAPSVYTWIGPDEGLTTFEAPDVEPASVHSIASPAPLDESVLWREMQECAEALERSEPDGYPASRVRAVMASIERAGASDGVTPDRITWKEWADRSVARMHVAMRSGNYDDFIAPALDIVRAYLDFELPGMLARDILVALLSMQCNVPTLGPPTKTAQEHRVAALEWLGEQTYALHVDRRDRNVTAHAEMTYLLTLYAATSAALWATAQRASEAIPNYERIARLAQSTEERAAHHAAMAFALPAMFAPSDILAWLSAHSREDRDPLRTAEHYSAAPSLASLLGRLAAPANELIRAFQADSRARTGYAIRDELANALSPIAPFNRDKIGTDMTAMVVGRQIP